MPPFVINVVGTFQPFLRFYNCRRARRTARDSSQVSTLPEILLPLHAQAALDLPERVSTLPEILRWSTSPTGPDPGVQKFQPFLRFYALKYLAANGKMHM